VLGTQRRGPRKIGGFLLAVVASALLVAWWSGVASAAAVTGTVEVCKSDANGTVGQIFDFQLYKGNGTNNPIGSPAAVTVQGGGSCATLATGLNVANANGPITYHIAETLDPSTPNPQVWQIVGAANGPGSNASITGFDASKGTVTFTLDQNGGENAIVISNALAGASLKICKVSSDQSIIGNSYTFTLLGQQVSATAQAVGSNDPALCSFPIAIQQGSKIVVTEAIPDGEFIKSATGSPTNGPTVLTTGTDLSVGKVKVQIIPGVNVLTFDNEILPQTQNGNLEICKVADDPFINQIPSFHFTIQAGNGTFQTDVAPGQCSGPINGTAPDSSTCQSNCPGVAAGSVTITELIPDGANWRMVTAVLHQGSAGGIGLVTPLNGTAIISQPVASAGEVVVDFHNVTNTATVKVCKFLSAGSGALSGKTFHFTVNDSQIVDNNGDPIDFPVSIVASPPGSSGACVFAQSCDRYGHNCVNLQVPVGSTVTATESNSDPFIDAGAGAGNDFTTPPHTVTMGVNELDITNTALGQLEFCKYMVPGDDGLGQTFTLRYSGPKSGTATTTAGNCSFPVVLPAGNYTVSEDLSKLVVVMGNGQKVPAFLFAGSDARGPFGDSRCVPPVSYPQPAPPWYAPGNDPLPPPGTGCGASFTVNVPYFNSNDPSTGETVVSFWNSQVRGQVKVCKVVNSNSTATLLGTTWTYSISSQDLSLDNYQTVAIANGGCTGKIGNIPVALQCGSALCPNRVTVRENMALGPQTNWFVANITVTGGYDVTYGAGGPVSGVVYYHTGAGPNVVTYTNQACNVVTGCPGRI
jgi:hypothetical protein